MKILRQFGKRVMLVLTMLALLTIFVSCGQKNVSSGSVQTLQALGEAFKTQIEDEYLYIRQSTDKLIKQPVVLVTDDKTYNIDYLYTFYDHYKMAENAELITVFKSKSYVVVKLVFEGNAGYYLRYEFDPLNETAINIKAQMLDTVEIKDQPELNKVELKLMKGKAQPIVFTYKSIVTTEE